jgi:hypothetical protein
MFSLRRRRIDSAKSRMADQIVITEKSSQAKDVRAAVGSRFGDILPAEGHLFDLLEPEDVVPAWKRWSPILLRPEGLYGTRPAESGNKAAKLKAIREAFLKECNVAFYWTNPLGAYRPAGALGCYRQ